MGFADVDENAGGLGGGRGGYEGFYLGGEGWLVRAKGRGERAGRYILEGVRFCRVFLVGELGIVAPWAREGGGGGGLLNV